MSARVPARGPVVRTDLVDVYVVRIARAGPHADDFELLQLRRARPPHAGSWQPVMGHVEPGETAVVAARREALEEVGLRSPGPECAGLWALERVRPYFIADRDEVWLTPRFVAQAAPGWSPTLNTEHDGFRWVGSARAVEAFLWMGQVDTVAEIAALLAHPARRAALRCDE